MGWTVFFLVSKASFPPVRSCFRFPPDLCMHLLIWRDATRPSHVTAVTELGRVYLDPRAVFCLVGPADPSSAGPSEGLTSVCLFLAALEENLAGFSRCSLSWSSQINQIYGAGHMSRQRDPAHPDPRSASEHETHLQQWCCQCRFFTGALSAIKLLQRFRLLILTRVIMHFLISLNLV